MKLGIVCCPMPRLGTEKTPVFTNSHVGLVCELGGICVCFHWLCTGFALTLPQVQSLLSSCPSDTTFPVSAAVKDPAGMWM